MTILRKKAGYKAERIVTFKTYTHQTKIKVDSIKQKKKKGNQ